MSCPMTKSAHKILIIASGITACLLLGFLTGAATMAGASHHIVVDGEWLANLAGAALGAGLTFGFAALWSWRQRTSAQRENYKRLVSYVEQIARDASTVVYENAPVDIAEDDVAPLRLKLFDTLTRLWEAGYAIDDALSRTEIYDLHAITMVRRLRRSLGAASKVFQNAAEIFERGVGKSDDSLGSIYFDLTLLKGTPVKVATRANNALTALQSASGLDRVE